MGLVGTLALTAAVEARAQSALSPTAAAGVRGGLTTRGDGRAAKSPASAKPPKPRKTKPLPRVPEPVQTQDEFTVKAGIRNLLYDQRALWTSPSRLRTPDAFWLAPMVGVGGALLATDSEVSRRLSNSKSRLNRSSELSNYGVGSLLGGGAGLYLWGGLTHNPHEQETGFLSMESLADALVVNNAINLAAGRERPQVDNSRGRFWVGGRSFPSNHSVAAWSVASVIAHEYPGPVTRFLAYGLAAAVSASRITAKQHFPTDVLVGSALGWLVGQEVYRAHHDPELGGTTWNTFGELYSDAASDPANFGSPYVPLDSWVYPAFERLASVGYVRSDILGMRPWTRLECARLVDEAEDRLDATNANPPKWAVQIYQALKKEFQNDLDLLGGGSNDSAELDSVYARVTGISGKPLTDGYHFAQTITNDYGRPYQEGANAVAGFTGWGTLGPLVGYVQEEYQHAPSAPALPASASAIIPGVDSAFGSPMLPPMPALPISSTNQARVIDGYVGLAWHHWQLTAGRQSLWWGPDQGGPMMFSDNAAPVDMININRVSPFKLPWILGRIGPIRVQFFVGQLHGAQFTFGVPTGVIGQWGVPLSDQPMIQGEKFSFKPTPNLEFGFSGTGLFAGAGVPLTFKTLVHSVFRPFFKNGPPGCYNVGPGCPGMDPGDGRTGFDMTYRLPFLRNWVTFYTDSFSEDEVNPIAYFDRSANSAGLYFARLPKLPKITLRMEGVFTDLPYANTPNNLCCGYFYWNSRYRSGYTNDGNLMGSWVGRDGQGFEGWLTYWRDARDSVQLEFRHQKVSHQFLPYGGTVTDGGIQADWWFPKHLEVSANLQYERWIFPILATGQHSDFTTSVQITYRPRWRLH